MTASTPSDFLAALVRAYAEDVQESFNPPYHPLVVLAAEATPTTAPHIAALLLKEWGQQQAKIGSMSFTRMLKLLGDAL